MPTTEVIINDAIYFPQKGFDNLFKTMAKTGVLKAIKRDTKEFFSGPFFRRHKAFSNRRWVLTSLNVDENCATCQFARANRDIYSFYMLQPWFTWVFYFGIVWREIDLVLLTSYRQLVVWQRSAFVWNAICFSVFCPSLKQIRRWLLIMTTECWLIED